MSVYESGGKPGSDVTRWKGHVSSAGGEAVCITIVVGEGIETRVSIGPSVAVLDGNEVTTGD